MSIASSRQVENVTDSVIDIWRELFAKADVCSTDDFFALGGDSIMATVLMVHIEEQFEIQMDPIEVFEHPVLEDFVSVLRRCLEMSDAGGLEEGTL